MVESFLSPTTGFPVELSRKGEVVLQLEVDGLEPVGLGDWVALVPMGEWPEGVEHRPAQAVGLVTEVDDDRASVTLLGQRVAQLDFEALEGVPSATIEMALSKSIGRVLSRDGTSVRLSLTQSEGVSPGDLFFVLSEPRGGDDRLGARISALIQVTSTGAVGSDARIVHERDPIAPTATVLFAQHSVLNLEPREVVIVFARTTPDATTAGQFPVLATAVPEYQFDFQFSNIRVETHDVYLDPGTPDAAEAARELAPDSGVGVIVFGQEREDDFLYNITTYGDAPNPATTVGILSGGLPLRTPDGLEALSQQLSPSFLATAMALRGEHAEAIYFLEQILFIHGERMSEDVAYHLREHLALRYESIGRPYESFLLMGRDIARSHRDGNPYAELNALSIRQYLDRASGRAEWELQDTDTFLALGLDILPEEALLNERLSRGRVLTGLARFDEAEEQFTEVLHQARRQDDLRSELRTRFGIASHHFERGELEAAVEVMLDALADARVLGEDYPRVAHALLAQYYALSHEPMSSLEHLEMALAHAESGEDDYELASLYELAANLYFNFDMLEAALPYMQVAADEYRALNSFEDAGRALFQLGILEAQASIRLEEASLLEASYLDLVLATEVFLAIGDGVSAAEVFSNLGTINTLMRNGVQAAADFGRTIDLALAYNEPLMVAAAYLHTAELYEILDNHASAQLAAQAARLWAATFELPFILEAIEALERRLQQEI